ncbi:MAG: MFS transporter [Chloroflexota bacterium]|nr:MFS transporter [Chloroflexota bacterium]
MPKTLTELRAKKDGIYYGWVIVFVMATAGAVSMAMGSLNFGLFIKPMGDSLGIGRAWFGWAQTVRQIASALTSPAVGILIDRYGSRVMLPVAAIVTAGAMIGLSFMHEAVSAIVGVGSSFGMAFASDTVAALFMVAMFTFMGLVGMSGPGALVTSVPVLKWFVRNRGRAISFMALGIPVGAMVFVPLTQTFIDMWGWERAWLMLAIIGASVIAPLAAIFVRRQPEDMGLLPDGDSMHGPNEEDENKLNSGESADEVSWTVREAMRSPVFWSLVAMFSMVSLATSTVALHRIPDFADRGFDTTLIALATSFDAVCAGAASFTFGILVSRIPVRILGTLGFAFLAIASVMTILAADDVTMFSSMAIFGLGIGGMMFLQNFIWADYFGREHVGAIRGFSMPINLILGAAGAPIAGYVYDATGTYNTVWWVGVALMSSSALLALFTPPPKRAPAEMEQK